MRLNALKKIPSTSHLFIIARSFHRSSPNNKTYLTSPNGDLDKNIYDRYMCLPMPECKIQAKYIWIDGSGENLRSKTKTLDFVPPTYRDCPKWWCDGSSCQLSKAENSDVHLIPIAMYPDPFRRGNNKLVLCETYDQSKLPTVSNNRLECIDALNKVCDQDVWFGFCQKYYLVDGDGKPFGWGKTGMPHNSGQYYCGVGGTNIFAREVNECFYRCCLYCGVSISSTKAEDMPSQWDWQNGPFSGIKAADDLWIARFIAMRVAEDFGLQISFKPKLLDFPDSSGSALHVSISTRRMREDGGLKHIEEAVKKLSRSHDAYLTVCDPCGGNVNKQRLTGKRKASMFSKFSWGIANRTTSIKINRSVAEQKKGYFEDRRPGANADPYKVINALIRTCFLG